MYAQQINADRNNSYEKTKPKNGIRKYTLELYVLFSLSKFPSMMNDFSIKAEYFSNEERYQYFQKLHDLHKSGFEFGNVQHNIGHIVRQAGLDAHLIDLIEGHPVSNESQARSYLIQYLERYKTEQALIEFKKLILASLETEMSFGTLKNRIGRFADAIQDEASGETSHQSKSLYDILKKGIDKREEHLIKGTPIATTTGFKSLDKFLAGGLRPGDLHFFVAGGGTGKSTLAMQLAHNIVEKTGDYVIYFQAEMSEDQIADIGAMALMQRSMREMPTHQDIEVGRRGLLTQDYTKRIIVYDRTSLDTEYIMSAIRSEMRSRPIAAVIVDHVGFWKEAEWGNKLGDEIAQRTFAVKACKFIARELKVPIISLSHTNREVFKLRPGQWPRMDMIAGSSEIERAADSVHMIIREEATSRNISFCLKARVSGRSHADFVFFEYDPKTQKYTEHMPTPEELLLFREQGEKSDRSERFRR